MEKLFKHEMLDRLDANKYLVNGKIELSHCDFCEFGKHKRAPFPAAVTGTRATRVNELTHTDVGGPLPIPSLAGNVYYDAFTDDFTKRTHVDFMAVKNETFGNFQKYKVAAEKKHPGSPLARLRNDQGGEYMSKEFGDYLRDNGIKPELTTAGTPEQNAVAESVNRVLFNKMRCMMAAAGMNNDVGKPFWAHALDTANLLKNISPTNVIRADGTPAFITPYEADTGRRFNVQRLKRFGCVAYVHVQQRYRDKLDARCKKMIFVGYADKHKAWRCFDPVTKKVVISRDVTFDESANGIDLLTPGNVNTDNGFSNAGGPGP